jgi:hypothetical protein
MAANDLRMAQQEVSRLEQMVTKRKDKVADGQRRLKLAKARVATLKGKKK